MVKHQKVRQWGVPGLFTIGFDKLFFPTMPTTGYGPTMPTGRAGLIRGGADPGEGSGDSLTGGGDPEEGFRGGSSVDHIGKSFFCFCFYY